MYTAVYTAPESTVGSILYRKRIFLAGTIDMGNSDDWQKEAIGLIDQFCEKPNYEGVCVYNPRRKSWNDKWLQQIENPEFYQQVNWELDCLEKSTHILLNFSADSKSPVSLLEMGLYARSLKLHVVCPMRFYRKGNVDIVCERYRIPQHKNLETAIKQILK